MDADNAATTTDPLEKMLSALRSSNIIAVISPEGQVRSVSDCKEIGDKIMAGFSSSDQYSRKLAQRKNQNEHRGDDSIDGQGDPCHYQSHSRD